MQWSQTLEDGTAGLGTRTLQVGREDRSFTTSERPPRDGDDLKKDLKVGR